MLLRVLLFFILFGEKVQLNMLYGKTVFHNGFVLFDFCTHVDV